MFQCRIELHRLFFALCVPLALARQLACLAGSIVSDRDRVAAERLHLTLFIFDDLVTVDSVLVEMLREIGAQVRLAPFDVALERMIATDATVALRPRGRYAAIEELNDQLVIGCRTRGIHRRDKSRFSPHVTLGYHPAARCNEPIAPLGWRASELVLIDSYIGRTHHEVLGRWTLTGEAPRQLALF